MITIPPSNIFLKKLWICSLQTKWIRVDFCGSSAHELQLVQISTWFGRRLASVISFLCAAHCWPESAAPNTIEVEVLMHSSKIIRCGTLEAWLDAALHPHWFPKSWNSSGAPFGPDKAYHICAIPLAQSSSRKPRWTRLWPARVRVDLAGPSIVTVSPKKGGPKAWFHPGRRRSGAIAATCRLPRRCRASSAGRAAQSHCLQWQTGRCGWWGSAGPEPVAAAVEDPPPAHASAALACRRRCLAAAAPFPRRRDGGGLVAAAAGNLPLMLGREPNSSSSFHIFSIWAATGLFALKTYGLQN